MNGGDFSRGEATYWHQIDAIIRYDIFADPSHIWGKKQNIHIADKVEILGYKNKKTYEINYFKIWFKNIGMKISSLTIKHCRTRKFVFRKSGREI